MMANLNLKTGVGYKPKYHKGDLNDIARGRAESRSRVLTEEGRKNFDDIDWTKKGGKQVKLENGDSQLSALNHGVPSGYINR